MPEYNVPDGCPIPKDHVCVAFLSKQEADNKDWIASLYGKSAYLDDPIMIEEIGLLYPLICDKRELHALLLSCIISAEGKEISANT